MAHSYPHDLSDAIVRLWTFSSSVITSGGTGSLPDRKTLEYLISTCYQASIMREELRALQFRTILCGPSEFPEEHGPPHGFLSKWIAQRTTDFHDEIGVLCSR
jgi:hypothetical protein